MSTIKPRKYGRDELIDMAGDPVVVNLGCGQDDTGVGIDIHYNPDITYDLNDGIPIADGAADRIFAEHILEHLENPSKFLREVDRVLRADGVCHLEVPNVGWFPVRAWLSQDMHRFWQHKVPDRNGHWLARKLGRTEPERTAHKTLWTKALLAEYLEDAGLEFQITGTHWSRNLTVRAMPAGASIGPRTLHELERTAGGDLAANDYWAQTRARILQAWIDDIDPDAVLDIGCGSGYLTAAIADDDPSRLVFGIDNNAESINVARQRQTAAKFEVEDAFSLPYEADSFECVIFGDVLEHFEAPERLLRHARRVLTQKGRILVSVPALKRLYGPHDKHNDHHMRYTARTLDMAAGRAGFELERHRYTNTLPLPVYWLYQRVLKRSVPDGARGGHIPVIERIKKALINVETTIQFPVGITLLGQLKRDKT